MLVEFVGGVGAGSVFVCGVQVYVTNGASYADGVYRCAPIFARPNGVSVSSLFRSSILLNHFRLVGPTTQGVLGVVVQEGQCKDGCSRFTRLNQIKVEDLLHHSIDVGIAGPYCFQYTNKYYSYF